MSFRPRLTTSIRYKDSSTENDSHMKYSKMEQWEDCEGHQILPGSILSEYIPMQFPEIVITFGQWEHGSYGLSTKHFEWCLKEDVIDDSDYSQIFESNQDLRFLGYGGYFEWKKTLEQDQDIELPDPRHTGNDRDNERLRIPDVGICFGSQSIILRDSLFSNIRLSAKLGTKYGRATLEDPFQDIHEGFMYISFHNPLYLPRMEKRLRHVAVEERPFICAFIGECREQLFIHRDLMKQWHAQNITGFMSDYSKDYFDLKSTDDWQQIHACVYFDSFEDYQNNKSQVRFY